MLDDKEKKARQVLKRIFKDFSGTVMSRDDAVNKVGIKPFQNNTGPMHTYGYVTYDRADGKGRKILNIRLTKAGIEALAERSAPAGQPDPLTDLNALGEFVERFNARNRYWELKLVPRETPMLQR